MYHCTIPIINTLFNAFSNTLPSRPFYLLHPITLPPPLPLPLTYYTGPPPPPPPPPHPPPPPPPPHTSRTSRLRWKSAPLWWPSTSPSRATSAPSNAGQLHPYCPPTPTPTPHSIMTSSSYLLLGYSTDTNAPSNAGQLHPYCPLS